MNLVSYLRVQAPGGYRPHRNHTFLNLIKGSAGMPRGGKRRGTGRKPGASTVKTRAIANAAAASMKCTPLDYMLAIVADANAAEHRRDDMAKASAAFPHGAQFDASSGLIKYPDGLEISPPPFVPIAPTPALELTDQSTPRDLGPLPEPEPTPFPVLEAEPDGKIAQLARWRRRDDT